MIYSLHRENVDIFGKIATLETMIYSLHRENGDIFRENSILETRFIHNIEKMEIYFGKIPF
jgi:hypothetical protein